DLLHSGLPDLEHLLVRAPVEAAVRAVAEESPHARGILRLQTRAVDHRLALGGQLHALEPRPGEALEPRGVARVRIDPLDGLPSPWPVPPVVENRLRARIRGDPFGRQRGAGRVAAVPVHDQDPAEALAVEGVE